MRLRPMRARLQSFVVNRVRGDCGLLRFNFIVRIIIGLCVAGSIAGGTALAGTRAIPVASGGELQAQIKTAATKLNATCNNCHSVFKE